MTNSTFTNFTFAQVCPLNFNCFLFFHLRIISRLHTLSRVHWCLVLLVKWSLEVKRSIYIYIQTLYYDKVHQYRTNRQRNGRINKLI